MPELVYFKLSLQNLFLWGSMILPVKPGVSIFDPKRHLESQHKIDLHQITQLPRML